MPLYSSGDSVTTTQAVQTIPSDHQLAGWSFDPVKIQAGVIQLGGGTLQVARVKVTNALQLSTLYMNVTLGGLTLVSGRNYCGFYSDAGQLLGQTADMTTAWSTPGLKAMPIQGGPLQVTPWTWYKIAWYTNGLTVPSLSRGMNVSATVLNAGMSGTTLRFSTADTGLTTALPATIGTQTAADIAWWVAVG